MTRSEMPSANRKLHSIGYYKLSGRLLGKGNFARVEEATHSILYNKVAIKIIDTTKIKEEYVIRNLEREAYILARLSHPSIECLYETMRAGPMYYLVTELATGGDLCNFVKHQNGGRLNEKAARRFGRQLTSALVHMHNRGVVHRDLKMENIMLDATREHIKIVDFGLSHSWCPDTALKTHCGSPEYAAPELFIVGHSYGPEVDLWSLGVVMYGMVVGRLPFVTPRDDGLSPTEKRRLLLNQINKGLTHYQRKALVGLSAEFRNVVGRLLVPNVEKRMSLKELMFHPWVTSRQKNTIADYEYRKLTPFERGSIMNRIAGLLHMGSHEVYELDIQLQMNSYGKIGGMYNILAHVQHMVNRELDAVKWPTSAPRSRTLTVKVRPEKYAGRSQSMGRRKAQTSSALTAPSRSQSPEVDVAPRPKSAAHPQNQVIKTLVRPRMSSILHNSSKGSSLYSQNSSLTKFSPLSLEPRRPISPAGHAVREAWSEHSSHPSPIPSSRLRVVGSRGVSHHFNQRQGFAGCADNGSDHQLQQYHRISKTWGNCSSNNQNSYVQHHRRLQEQQQQQKVCKPGRPHSMYEQRCKSQSSGHRLRNRPGSPDTSDFVSRNVERSPGDRYSSRDHQKTGEALSRLQSEGFGYGSVITDSSVTSTSSSGYRDPGELPRHMKVNVTYQGIWSSSPCKSAGPTASKPRYSCLKMNRHPHSRP